MSEKLNRLAAEKSPYLKSHATNPVDWYPWCEDAFARARELVRPIFLSIGYSTCHWCHVMERESFEDETIAEILNKNYVAIKVDREERPDIDRVYMRVCQSLTGRGGWPLTILMTPEGNPFFAATYLPKENRGQATGLIGLLVSAADLWRQEPERVVESAQKLIDGLQSAIEGQYGGESPEINPHLFEVACRHAETTFDAKYGGFGDAPKFPAPHQLSYLLSRYRRTLKPHLLNMVTTTLEGMRAGGIWDHVGGGFHRYSTDRKWLTPHFEKMLYDQAGLASIYLDAYLATGREEYALTFSQIFEYVERDLGSTEGGFCCGEDADSEGEEGLFYTWTAGEIETILGAEAEGFMESFGVLPEGNFFEEGTGTRSGRNILHVPLPDQFGLQSGVEKPTEREAWHKTSLEKLFEARGKRVRPLLDDKVLTGWSAFAAGVFIRAGAALGEERYLKRGKRCVDFLLSTMGEGGTLYRRHKEGESSIEGFSEDYAFLGCAALELYSATFEGHYLERAAALATTLAERFMVEGGALSDTGEDGEALVLEFSDATDTAMPSATSVAFELFMGLWLITGDQSWEERGRRLLEANAALLTRYPEAFTHLLTSLSIELESARRIEMVGQLDAEELARGRAMLAGRYMPESYIAFTESAQSELAVRICSKTACHTELKGLDELEAWLKRERSE